MFRVNQQAVFDRVDCNESNCEDCGNLTRIVEEEGVEFECTGDKFDCHQVDARKDEVEAFQSDNQEMFELLEWTD